LFPFCFYCQTGSCSPFRPLLLAKLPHTRAPLFLRLFGMIFFFLITLGPVFDIFPSYYISPFCPCPRSPFPFFGILDPTTLFSAVAFFFPLRNIHGLNTLRKGFRLCCSTNTLLVISFMLPFLRVPAQIFLCSRHFFLSPLPRVYSDLLF